MNRSHDGDEEDVGGIGAGRGVFSMDESSSREGSGCFRVDVCTGVFGFINKSGTLMLENEGSVGAGTGESIGSFEEGSGTVTGSDDADGGLMVTCSLLACSTTW